VDRADELAGRLEAKADLVDWHRDSRTVRLAVFAKSFGTRPESENIFTFDLKDLEKAPGRHKGV
jgi:hypothetical protein